jgi:hypothetical protein
MAAGRESLSQLTGKERMTRSKIIAVRLVVLALLLAVAFAGAYERFAELNFLDW